uniref:Uncharacterized protein n=1 Tax=Lepeophtheirus salmonis TaxID=72036 RepID=A0A0K2V9H6_LEPSM
MHYIKMQVIVKVTPNTEVMRLTRVKGGFGSSTQRQREQIRNCEETTSTTISKFPFFFFRLSFLDCLKKIRVRYLLVWFTLLNCRIVCFFV